MTNLTLTHAAENWCRGRRTTDQIHSQLSWTITATQCSILNLHRQAVRIDGVNGGNRSIEDRKRVLIGW